MSQVAISCGTVSATVALRGAMTTGTFLVDGRSVEPFHIAGWDRFPDDRLLDRLRGDFPCVPFGITPDGPLPGWPAGVGAAGELAHGYSCHADWEVVALADDRVELTVVYPEGDPVERLTRIVTCTDGGIDFDDRIVTRVDVDLPLGLHPIFRLPDRPGGASLELPGARWIQSPAAAPEPTSLLIPGRRFDDPTSAPALAGTVDLTSLPWAGASEDLVLLVDVDSTGFAIVNHDEGYRARLTWDTAILRHLMLWLSQRGRDRAPWDGQNLCLGVEPVTAAFDYGASVSGLPNPLSEAGAATTVHLTAGRELVIRHRIDVEAL